MLKRSIKYSSILRLQQKKSRGKHVKKSKIAKTSAILVLALLAVSLQLSSINAINMETIIDESSNTDASTSAAISTWKPLTDSEIKTNWPNLPTAKEIWIIDSRNISWVWGWSGGFFSLSTFHPGYFVPVYGAYVSCGGALFTLISMMILHFLIPQHKSDP